MWVSEMSSRDLDEEFFFFFIQEEKHQLFWCVHSELVATQDIN